MNFQALAGPLAAVLAAWAFGMSSALAIAPLGRLEPAEVPEGGHWVVEGHASYTPYTTTLEAGATQAKDCAPGSTDPKCTSGRPVTSRHWAEAAAAATVGLGGGVGLEFKVPLDLVVQFTQDPSKLPPGLPGRNLAVGNVELGLDRQVFDLGSTRLMAQLAGTVAPMGAPGGNEVCQCPVKDAHGNQVVDASGNPVVATDVVFPDPPTARFALAFAQDLVPDALRLTANASVTYPFRRTGAGGVETWNGLSYDWGAGLAYWFLPQIGANVDLLGDWSNPAEQDGAIVCITGHDIWQLSVGLGYQPLQGVTVGANVLFPVYATGYQWDFVYPVLSTLTIRESL